MDVMCIYRCNKAFPRPKNKIKKISPRITKFYLLFFAEPCILNVPMDETAMATMLLAGSFRRVKKKEKNYDKCNGETGYFRDAQAEARVHRHIVLSSIRGGLPVRHDHPDVLRALSSSSSPFSVAPPSRASTISSERSRMRLCGAALRMC